MPPGHYFGSVTDSVGELRRQLPEVSDSYLGRYAAVHHYALVSMAQALAHADLDWRSGAAREAAVITGRSGVDTIVQAYRSILERDPTELLPDEAKNLFMGLALSGTVTDVANVQASFLRNSGPTYCVSCGCASSALALGEAARLIRSGESDIAVVTGVDAWDLTQARHLDRIRDVMKTTMRKVSFTEPKLQMDRPMRPYDASSGGFNMGDGAATLVLESRRHAEARGATNQGELLGQVTRRSAGPSALATAGLDEALTRAGQDLIQSLPWARFDYINGGAQGDEQFNQIESAAVARLFPRRKPLVSSQEACFGHVASALGIVGAAATVLMIGKRAVAPTAECRTPAPGLTFDPVVGDAPRRVPRLRQALSINYQVGGVASALALGGAR